MYAAQQCHVENTRQLLAFHAQVRKKDSMGRSAVVHAIRNGCLPVVQILISRSSPRDLVFKDKAGKSALDYARKGATLDVDGDAVSILKAVRTVLLETGSAKLRKNPESIRWDSKNRKWMFVPSPAQEALGEPSSGSPQPQMRQHDVPG
jgi:hypothetical protein